MPSIKIKDIVIPTGQRIVQPPKLKLLAESIELIGLQSPVKLRLEDGVYTLVFGFMRLTAYKRLGRDAIEYSLFEGTAHEARLAYLDENLQRTELDKPDRMVCTAKRYR